MMESFKIVDEVYLQRDACHLFYSEPPLSYKIYRSPPEQLQESECDMYFEDQKVYSGPCIFVVKKERRGTRPLIVQINRDFSNLIQKNLVQNKRIQIKIPTELQVQND